MVSQAEICARYAAFPDLRQHVADYLKPGMRVLDLGGGAYPTVLPENRPPGIHYVGFDISEEELLRAPLGSYDEIRACNVLHRLPDLAEQFDLILTVQTLEHIKPLDVAIENLRSYLRLGGEFIAQMTGTFTYFSMLNRVVPPKMKNWVLYKIHQRPEDDIFPAYYDKCWHGALEKTFSDWSDVQIKPYYTGGGYLNFSVPMFKLYLQYEDWVARNNHRNLASHYFVRAVK